MSVAERTLPGLGLHGYWPEGTDHWGDDMDSNLRLISVLLQGSVKDAVAAVPAGPAAGDIYILTAAPNKNAIAIFDGDAGAEAWVYIQPKDGWTLWNQAARYSMQYTSSAVAWAEVSSGGGGGGGGTTTVTRWVIEADGTGASQDIADVKLTGLTVDDVIVNVNGVFQLTTSYTIAGDTLTITTDAADEKIEIHGFSVSGSGGGGGSGGTSGDLVVAVSDETTAITAGVAKLTFRAPRAMTLTEVRASLTTASSGAAPTIDVKKNGVSIFSTLLTIDAGEKTSATAAIPAVLSATEIADDDEIKVDVTVAGTGAAGLKLYLVAEVEGGGGTVALPDISRFTRRIGTLIATPTADGLRLVTNPGDPGGTYYVFMAPVAAGVPWKLHCRVDVDTIDGSYATPYACIAGGAGGGWNLASDGFGRGYAFNNDVYVDYYNCRGYGRCPNSFQYDGIPGTSRTQLASKSGACFTDPGSGYGPPSNPTHVGFLIYNAGGGVGMTITQYDDGVTSWDCGQ